MKITTIKPKGVGSGLDYREIWSYRELWLTLTMRDIKVRYKQTVLGFSWALIQPLTTMIIFTLLFGRLAKIPSEGVPYPIFVFSGLLAWNFFNSAVSSGGSSLLSAGSMISKVYFPRIIIPLATIGVSVADFLIALMILIVLMIIYDISPNWQLLLFPFFYLGLVLTVIGVCTWLSAVTVVYRDFRFIIPFMLQLWMYVTPVIYPVSFIPERWRFLLYLNPIAGWVGGIRSSVLGSDIAWDMVIASLALSILLFYVGLRKFERAERRFADVI